MPDHRIEVRHRVPASRRAIWEAWADPRMLAGWFVDAAEGRLDREPRVTWTWSDFGLRSVYDVAEAHPPEAFELRAALPEGAGHALRVELEEVEEQATEIRVIQWDFPDATQAQAARSGWKIALALLDLYLERYAGRERHSFLLMAPVTASPAVIRDLFRTAPGLAAWLGGSDGLPGEGGRFVIRLDAAGTLTGRVLCTTRYETAVTWEEIDGALELKLFPGPDEWVAALRVSSWSEREDLEEERAILEAAFDRLLQRAHQPV